jgi:hypothetical protein
MDTREKPADQPQQQAEHSDHSHAAAGASKKLWENAYSASPVRQTPAANVEKPATKVQEGTVPVGMAWNQSGVPLPDYHIVIGDASQFGLQWNNSQFKELSTGFTAGSIKKADHERAIVKQENPNVKEFLEIRYREAPPAALPKNSDWWMRDSKGHLEGGFKGQGTVFPLLNFENPQFQDHVAEQAAAAVKSGAVDGVMLDCYAPTIGDAAQEKAREELIAKVRKAIGPKALILINTNDEEAPKDITDKVNGYYMESIDSSTPANWSKIKTTLNYAEQNTLSPHVNFVETQGPRDDQAKARATATLALTNAPDAATSYGDLNATSKIQHGHDFYKFYNTNVGEPVGKLITRPDGSEIREYSNGTVLYNPDGNRPVEIKFATPREGASTGKIGKAFTVNGEDGDIFLYQSAVK